MIQTDNCFGIITTFADWDHYNFNDKLKTSFLDFSALITALNNWQFITQHYCTLKRFLFGWTQIKNSQNATNGHWCVNSQQHWWGQLHDRQIFFKISFILSISHKKRVNAVRQKEWMQKKNLKYFFFLFIIINVNGKLICYRRLDCINYESSSFTWNICHKKIRVMWTKNKNAQ